MYMDTSKTGRIFLQVLSTIKLYHWRTFIFSRHKASDYFYKETHEIVDHFIEVMTTRYGRGGKDSVSDKNVISLTDQDAPQFLKEYILFIMNDITPMLDPVNDSDLLSLKDDLLGIAKRTLFLFTLN